MRYPRQGREGCSINPATSAGNPGASADYALRVTPMAGEGVVQPLPGSKGWQVRGWSWGTHHTKTHRYSQDGCFKWFQFLALP